jgi:hypothetical protein
MVEMPRPRLPYVTLEIARGKRFWYFRRGRGLRIRLRGDWGRACASRQARDRRGVQELILSATAKRRLGSSGLTSAKFALT